MSPKRREAEGRQVLNPLAAAAELQTALEGPLRGDYRIYANPNEMVLTLGEVGAPALVDLVRRAVQP